MLIGKEITLAYAIAGTVLVKQWAGLSASKMALITNSGRVKSRCKTELVVKNTGFENAEEAIAFKQSARIAGAIAGWKGETVPSLPTM